MTAYKNLAIISSFALFLAGCMNEQNINKIEGQVEFFYNEDLLFALHECKGVEVTSEWVGPRGPNGPPPPPTGWGDLASDFTFSLTMDLIKCQRIGWGPLERGPLWIALEYHNAYAIPESCRDDLEDTAYLRFLNRMYIEDKAVVSHAEKWSIPAIESKLRREEGEGSSSFIINHTGEVSKIVTHHLMANGEEAPNIIISLFWFDEDLVHRLTLKREAKISVGNVATMEMSPPTIMSDQSDPQLAAANLFANLNWTGDLVTFSDPTCTEQVFP